MCCCPSSDSAPARARAWLVLDVGGVLFADGAKTFLDTLADHERAAARALIRSPAAMAMRRGTLDEETFWSAYASDLPSGWTAQKFRAAWYSAYTPNDEIFEWVREVHGQISLAIFSGNVRSRVETLETRRPFRRWFDAEIWSYEHGATKPEPAFARALLTVLGTSPQQIFYVDDKEAPLRTAANLGITGFLYRPRDVATLKKRFAEFCSRLSES